MSSRFQSAVLGSSLVYPNAVTWSEENLVAVACGTVVLILNPGNPAVRGVITIPSSKPFSLGVVDGGEQDLLNECLLPCHLSKDARPCVRSIAWSPVGLAENAGCLLAVCTNAGRVKLFRLPFCEFSVEWVEITDISEMLYSYLMSTSFGEYQIVSSESLDVTQTEANADHECIDDLPVCTFIKKCKRRRKNAASVATNDPDYFDENNRLEIVPVSFYERKKMEKVREDCNPQLINVQQYASRNAMLMSLTVAWSPILWKSGNDVSIPHNSHHCCSILAVGGKCGRVSFWRVRAPECYSIHKTRHSSKISLVGLQKAHDTWITAIDWALYDANVSKPQFLLATGTSEGRVRIWQVNGEELQNSSEVIQDPFSLLKEVMADDSATISVLSLVVPSKSPWKLHLAIGKGSGSFEVWILDIPTSNLEKIGCHSAHDRVVTGLAWAFGGRCLYSCSQDNSMKSWILLGNSMCEMPSPSSPFSRSSPDVPSVFDSCFGLALSNGNLAIAVARRFAADLLHPMYEGRTHKTAIDFFWIGGQQLDFSTPTLPDTNCKSFPGFHVKELAWWESNVLWSLKQYENLNRLLNIWDIVAVLNAFKESAPQYIKHILLKWLTSLLRTHLGISITRLCDVYKFLSKLSSRHLHLINIISRHVMLKECKADNMISGKQDLEESSDAQGERNLWMELLMSSENELLERLVGISLSAILGLLSDSLEYSFKDGFWRPDGVPHMKKWVSHYGKNVKDHSKFLASEVGKVDKRKLHDLFKYKEDELCNFCSAVVPFEATEYAICSGGNGNSECNQRHKVERCAVTMQILPTKPSWHCMCCKRWATKLPPRVLFAIFGYPSDFKSFIESSELKNLSTPCCPFCGTLLQRLQPPHSLMPSPV